MKTLFRADILLSDFSVLRDGYLGVDGDKIDYVGATQPPQKYDTVREMKHHLLMAGLYNLHTHTSMTLLRGVGSDLPLHRWLEEAMFPVEAKMTQEDISVGTRLAMLEMLAGGTVSFSDMYDMPRITAEEVTAAGMKANLPRPMLSFDPAETFETSFRVKESLEFFDDWHNKADGRIKVDFAIHAEYTSHAGIVQSYGAACKERGAIMHLHLSETRKEQEECKQRHDGKTPARYFNDLGVFDSPTIAAHCVMVDDGDIEILREKQVTAVHNPSSNMKLGSGFMPITKMMDKGVRIALGTDGAASNNNVNMFEEMHLASVLHKGHANDPTIVTPAQLLTMATAAGAAAQGRTDCGEIKVGNKADIIAINLDKPHLMPVHDIAPLLVYSAQASDVAMTMIDGKILYENGEYLTIDKDKVVHDLKASIARLFG